MLQNRARVGVYHVVQTLYFTPTGVKKKKGNKLIPIFLKIVANCLPTYVNLEKE